MSSHGKIKKIIIDTDPGVDDAMAIMIALEAHKQDRIEVLAITLVKGNASIKDSKRNILRVLQVFGLIDNGVTSLIVSLSPDTTYGNTFPTHSFVRCKINLFFLHCWHFEIGK